MKFSARVLRRQELIDGAWLGNAELSEPRRGRILSTAALGRHRALRVKEVTRGHIRM